MFYCISLPLIEIISVNQDFIKRSTNKLIIIVGIIIIKNKNERFLWYQYLTFMIANFSIYSILTNKTTFMSTHVNLLPCVIPWSKHRSRLLCIVPLYTVSPMKYSLYSYYFIGEPTNNPRYLEIAARKHWKSAIIIKYWIYLG